MSKLPVNSNFTYLEYLQMTGQGKYNDISYHLLNIIHIPEFASVDLAHDALILINPKIITGYLPTIIEVETEGENAVLRHMSTIIRKNPDYRLFARTYNEAIKIHGPSLEARQIATLAILKAKELNKIVKKGNIKTTAKTTKYKTNYFRVRVTYIANLPVSEN